MNQKKIGEYIANKRKSLGLTQAQVAERLGMSDKSVSKWERGVCLPDVSVYANLCEILGITINEFLAGEDIEPAQIESRAEENIIKVSRFAKLNGRFFKRIIVVLAIIMVLLAVVLGAIIIHGGYLSTNYIQGSSSKSTQQLADMIGGSEPTVLCEYKVKSGFKEVNITVDAYKDGKKIPAVDFSSQINGKQDRKGYVVVAPNLERGTIKAGVITDSGSGFAEGDLDKSLTEYAEKQGGSSCIADPVKVTAGESLELAAFYYQMREASDSFSVGSPGSYEPIAKGVTFIVKCTFK